MIVVKHAVTPYPSFFYLFMYCLVTKFRRVVVGKIYAHRIKFLTNFLPKHDISPHVLLSVVCQMKGISEKNVFHTTAPQNPILMPTQY